MSTTHKMICEVAQLSHIKRASFAVQMEAVREAYADMRSTAEAAQDQLSDLQIADQRLHRQLSVCKEQVPTWSRLV